jgi:hypothetical protein
MRRELATAQGEERDLRAGRLAEEGKPYDLDYDQLVVAL